MISGQKIAALSVKVSTLVLGLPINVLGAVETLRNMRKPRYTHNFNFLRCNLLVINMLILILYNSGSMFLVLSPYWHGGLLLCKTAYFVFCFCFYSQSFITCAIAAERVVAVLNPFQNRGECIRTKTKVIISLAWLTAGALSLPQLAIFRTMPFGRTEEVCTTTWQVARLLTCYHNMSQNDSGDQVRVMRCLAARANLEVVYGYAHLTCLFWVPVSIVVVCHVIIINILNRRAAARLFDRRNAVTDRDLYAGLHHSIHTRMHMLNKRLLKKVVLLCSLYVLLCTPYSLLGFFELSQPDLLRNIGFDLADFLTDFMILYALINPLIFKEGQHVSHSRRLSPHGTTPLKTLNRFRRRRR